jgi:hypothetical protein
VLGAVAGSDLPLPMDDATAFEWFRRATHVWKTRATTGPAGVPARVALASIARAELAWLVRTNAAIDPARWTDAFSAGLAAREDPDTKARRPAALALVELADLHVRYEEKRFTTSHGKEGFAARAHALVEPLRVRPEEPLPSAIEDAVRARDGATLATEAASFDLLTGAAGLLLAYGHTAEAQRRLSLLVSRTCRERGGFAAFALAAKLARATKDDAELARLAALNADPATTCAKSPADVAQGRALTR